MQFDTNNYETQTIRNILPKANEIVDIELQFKRTIYPFKMIHHTHQILQSISSEQYINNSQIQKFIPPKSTVISHFTKQFIIYDKFNTVSEEDLFNSNIFSIDKLKNLRNNDYIMSTEHTQAITKQDSLVFDSRFQSGNLSYASKVEGVYCLLLHNDVNTGGYTNWFYFSVKCRYPATFKFAIMNYGKAGWPYNQGIGICTYSSKNKSKKWIRGGNNIQCTSNLKIYTNNKFFNNFNTLSFQYTFNQENQEVFFSYNIPYTYTQLCTFLDSIQSKKLPFFYRKLAGRSLAGNRLQMITIANYQGNKVLAQNMPVIVMLGRSHSGQTVSSWVIKQFIEFLISEDVSACILRDNFIFKIFPMINPDGVIHGNYRCSLSGRDLNRRWTKPSKDLFPQVYYIKNQILQIAKHKNIRMILDMHGHSQKKKVFIYGCNDKFQPHKCRLFPYIMSKISQHFQYNLCNFSIDKSKLSTARVTLYNSLRLPDVFTIQSSQYGTFVGHLNNKILKQIGESIAKSLIIYLKPTNYVKSPEMQKALIKGKQLQQQLISNEELLQSGNNADSGSEREPSVDNIGYQKLAKITQKKQIQQFKLLNRSRTKDLQKYQKVSSINDSIFVQTPKVRSESRNTNRECSTTDGVRTKLISQRWKKEMGRTLTRDKINISNLKTPTKLQKTQVLKLINFSLSINNEKNYVSGVMTKKSMSRNIPSFQYGETTIIYRNLINNKSNTTNFRQ